MESRDAVKAARPVWREGWGKPWLVDSFLNEAEWRVKIRFRVIDFNLLWGY
jgi:hypothetical protein